MCYNTIMTKVLNANLRNANKAKNDDKLTRIDIGKDIVCIIDGMIKLLNQHTVKDKDYLKENINDIANLISNKIIMILGELKIDIKTNNVMIAAYLYRYTYELCLKITYIYINKQERNKRLDLFLKGEEKWRACDMHTEIKKLGRPVINNHEKFYKFSSKLVHPNIESLRELHVNNSASEEKEFIFKCIATSILFIEETIIILKDDPVFKNFDFEKLTEMITKINNLYKYLK